MIGFSTSAFTTLSIALADAPGTRPAVLGLIYGKQEAVAPPADPPPLFVALATDELIFWRGSTGLVESCGKAGGKVEFHLYQNGCHGFGLGAAATTTVTGLKVSTAGCR